MKYTIIKEYEAINKYMNQEFRAIYNNNIEENSYMIADFNKSFNPNHIIPITPKFRSISELLNYYYLMNEYPIGNYHGSIRFMPNCIIERY